MENNQLTLSEQELSQIGFTKNEWSGDELNSPRTTYEISTINSCFYYNMKDEKYRWYHKTIIGESTNHVHLSIESISELLLVLSCFRVNINYKYLLTQLNNKKDGK